ncbi:7219_t:CDS:10 [Diversispora eburnea]|uniref:Ubiquitin-like 1-activating enzyme E1A n=1 Tax=Diversispora eburnea TaxID=1213867 RepID=A0A9N8V9M2_9GLOM|nr:7219_t:CDS:10 [Diversispora eburnea]
MEDTVTPNIITEDEAALYDRQIRLWGLEAQQRGLNNEVCKNLVLAGIGTVTIIDHNVVTEEDLGAQFFVTAEDIGKNRAHSSVNRVNQLNPRVKVISDSSNLNTKPEEFFQSFDLVCLTDGDPDTMLRIDEICRKFNKKFYAASTYGYYGYIFCDLNQHEYILERKIKIPHSAEFQVKVLKHKEEYFSLQEVLSKSDWSKVKRIKKVTPLLWAILILWKFQQEKKRLPDVNNTEDIDKLNSVKDSYLQSLNIVNTTILDELIESITRNSTAEITPVCAILGGILAQDILNALSRRGNKYNGWSTEKQCSFRTCHDAKTHQPSIVSLDAGILPEKYYEKLMNPSRFQLRRIFLPLIYKETNLLVKIQDFLCLPRPISPPVKRLINSYFRFEYGFPSTHSTNSVSIALLILTHLLTMDNNMTLWMKYLYFMGLFFYSASIVCGRIYCGMHSFCDVIAGTIIGILIWWFQVTYQKHLDNIILSDDWFVPAGAIIGSISLIYLFPEPVDKCPCIEDCISCIGVIIGVTVGSWRFGNSNYSLPNGNVPYDYNKIGIFLSLVRVIFGLLIIFTFRTVMKKFLYTILKPIYTFKYQESNLSIKNSIIGIHEDNNLSLNTNTTNTSIESFNNNGSAKHVTLIKPSNKINNNYNRSKFNIDTTVKLLVYSGIAWLATDGIPVLFEILGMSYEKV